MKAYKEAIKELRTAIQQKRLQNCERKIMLYHNNVKIHKVDSIQIK